jgi:hypothetical protein
MLLINEDGVESGCPQQPNLDKRIWIQIIRNDYQEYLSPNRSLHRRQPIRARLTFLETFFTIMRCVCYD